MLEADQRGVTVGPCKHAVARAVQTAANAELAAMAAVLTLAP